MSSFVFKNGSFCFQIIGGHGGGTEGSINGSNGSSFSAPVIGTFLGLGLGALVAIFLGSLAIYVCLTKKDTTDEDDRVTHVTNIDEVWSKVILNRILFSCAS